MIPNILTWIPVPNDKRQQGQGKLVRLNAEKVREKSRECHNHKPQLFPDPKRKRKPTTPNKHKPNKRTKSTKISSLFPKRGNRNTKRTEKHKNKMTHGKTYNKSPRRINHKATNERVDRGAGTGVKGAGDGGKGTGEEGAGVGKFLGRVLPKFVVFYRFYSIFMYFNAITGYQTYLIDVLK